MLEPVGAARHPLAFGYVAIHQFFGGLFILELMRNDVLQKILVVRPVRLAMIIEPLLEFIHLVGVHLGNLIHRIFVRAWLEWRSLIHPQHQLFLLRFWQFIDQLFCGF